MKAKIFCGTPIEAVEAFNEWAKDKILQKDVIIHTVYLPVKANGTQYNLAIVVYYPERWGKPKGG